MARVALTTVGAVVGFYFGGPAGASFGAQLGGLAGGLIDPGPGQTGPRLTDLATAPSTHGAPISQVVGTAPVGCDQIWVNKNKLTERKSSSSAKGGPEVTTFSYYGTFAVAICEGEIDAIKRIWAGDKLIAEFSSDAFDDLTTPETWSAGQADAVKTAFASVGMMKGVNLTIYKGTETQEPDPLIEADLTYAPAYRGLAYMVFEDLPLEKFGNAIPPIRVEVVKDATLSMPVVGFQDALGSHTQVMYDPAREMLWTSSTPLLRANSAQDGAIVLDVDHNGEAHPGAALWPAVDDTFGESGSYWTGVPPIVTPDGSLVLMTERQETVVGGYSFIHSFDATTGALRSTYTTILNFQSLGPGQTFGPLGYETPFPIPLYHVVRNVSPLGAMPVEYGASWLYGVISRSDRIAWGWIRAADAGLYTMDGAAKLQGTYTEETISFDFDTLGSYIYAVGGLSGSVTVEKIKVSPPDACPAFPSAGNATVATESLGSTIGDAVGCRWDRTAETFCVWGELGIAILDADLNVISSRSLSLTGHLVSSNLRSTNTFAGAVNNDDGFVWLNSPSYVYKISTATGETLQTIDKSLGPDEYQITKTGPHFDMGVSGGVLAADCGFGPKAAFPDLVAANRVNLRTACEFFAGIYLPPARIDASAISGTIHGYAVKSASVTARAALEDLGEINAFDMAEIDAAITFIPRGGASEGTIAEADFGSPKFSQTVGEAAALPRRIEVNYLGVESQYQPAQQAWQYPAEIGAQGATVRVQTNQVLTDAEGYAVAARSGAVALIERHEVEFKTSWRYQRVAPASIETVVVDGVSREVKVREIDGAWTLEMRGTLHDAAAYVVEGAPTSTALPPPVLEILSATDFEILDMALLRDVDDDNGFYVAAWPRFEARLWGGAAIYRADDGMSFVDWLAVDTASAAGRTAAALPAPVVFDNWDRVNTIDLVMDYGTPTSATEDALITSDVNAIAVQSGTDWEIIRFATATDNGDGSWTLSTLLRGQRGTEHLAGGHAPGDRVVFLNANALRRGGTSDYGLVRYFGAATLGDDFRPSDAFAHTNLARGRRPYSVAHLAGGRNGSSDCILTWRRRSRLHAGPWPHTRPLGEASESYYVRIYNPSTGALADTQTVTSATYTLTAAYQTTLFGSVKSNIRFEVAQFGDWGAGPFVEVTVA